ncbi:MAG: hypothetical protein K2L07_10570, partial [Lachnospiraceae bacterium]|nr:hypothetical protein [Lachnospiraceae bacterium]
MEEIFYVGWCPICRKYGRLEINKDVTNNEYLIRCEECLAEWKTPQDALKNINGQRCSKEREIRSATLNEIKSLGWDKFIVENFDKYEKLDKVYELVKQTGYIQSMNIYREMDHKSEKEYNLVLVLS